MELLQGRAFSKEYATDTAAVIINEAAMKAMALSSPVGKSLRYTRGDYVANIIGVVKDYNFRSLHSRIEPLVILFPPNYGRYLCVRFNTGNITNTISYIEEVWTKFEPVEPFEYRFLDESLDRLYRSEERVNKLVQYFTILAIFLSCLGLLGLSYFMAGQRTKEIGVRKVLGASVFSLVRLFSVKFTKWVLLSNLIAWPVAWFALNDWLQNFAFKVDLDIWIFILAAGITVFIAITTISFQAIKAALANPIDALRYE